MRKRRACSISGVRSTSGAENGAVHIVRDFAADRVAFVVPNNPKVGTLLETELAVHGTLSPIWLRRTRIPAKA